jgi:hypothetical protein
VGVRIQVVSDQSDVRFGSKGDMCAQNSMSALPPEPDMCGATSDVRFGPIADIAKKVKD